MVDTVAGPAVTIEVDARGENDGGERADDECGGSMGGQRRRRPSDAAEHRAGPRANRTGTHRAHLPGPTHRRAAVGPDDGPFRVRVRIPAHEFPELEEREK